MSTNGAPETTTPTTCTEVTWSGKNCKRRAKYVVLTRSGADGSAVCTQHLGSFGPGMPYRTLDSTPA